MCIRDSRNPVAQLAVPTQEQSRCTWVTDCGTHRETALWQDLSGLGRCGSGGSWRPLARWRSLTRLVRLLIARLTVRFRLGPLDNQDPLSTCLGNNMTIYDVGEALIAATMMKTEGTPAMAQPQALAFAKTLVASIRDRLT